MPSMGGGGRSGGDDTSGGASKGNGGMGSSGSGGESSGGKSSSRSDYGPTKSGGNLADSWGKGESSYREGPGRTGPNGKTQSWTAMDGWHDVDTALSAPSYFGSRMATTWGAKNPGQYARELGKFHDAQRVNTFNNQADVIEKMVDKLRADTNAGKLSHIDYAKNYANITHGNLESLRSIGLDTTEMEEAFSPSGFMDTISSWVGGQPDKVDTYAGLAQDYLDKGLVEMDDFGNLNVTNKGAFVGVAGPLSNFAPGLGNIVGGVGGAALGSLAKRGVDYFADQNPNKNASNLAGFINTAAPFAGQMGSTIAGFAPGVSMLDTLGYAKDLDDLGIAPGGMSYYGRDPYTGRIETTNQDVIDGMLDRAESRATPSESSESYPTNTNLSTPSNWPTFENTQQQPYQNQPWSWEQWNNYFR